MKKSIMIMGLACIFCSVSIIGCGSNKRAEVPANVAEESTTNTKEKPEEKGKGSSKKSKKGFEREELPSAKELVDSVTSSDDKYKEFKVKETEEYLNKLYTIQDLFTEDYRYDQKPSGMYKRKTISGYKEKMLQYDSTECKDKVEKMKKINEDNNLKDIEYEIIFDEEEGKEYVFQVVQMTLADPQGLGYIKLTEDVKTIIKTVYKDMDFDRLQKCVDKEYEKGLTGVYENNLFDTKDKHSRITLSSYFGEKFNSKEVKLKLQVSKDFPTT